MRSHDPWLPVGVVVLLLLNVWVVAAALAFGWVRLPDLSPPPPTISPVQTWTLDRRVTAVAFSPNGLLVAVGTTDGDIQLRQVSDGSVVRTLIGDRTEVRSLAFSPD